MTDTIELNIFVAVLLTMTLIQDHRSVKKQNFWANYLTKISIDLGEIWYAVETCWCKESYTLFF